MSDKPVELTKTNFDETIKGKKPVMVDFWASWCGPCQMMLPIVDDLLDSYKHKDKVIVAKLNIDKSPEIAGKYNVLSVPTFLFFNDGKVVHQQSGATSKEELEGYLDKMLKS